MSGQMVGDIHVHQGGASLAETAEVAAQAVRHKILTSGDMRGAVRRANRGLY